MPRKRRTREHVIADLSVNHFERWALLCGYSVERIEHDYGIDLMLFTYSEGGEIEIGQIYVQLKATDTLRVLEDQQSIALTVDRSDLELWLDEPMPVILVLYDAQSHVAYWLYVQAYLKRLAPHDEDRAGRTVTVHFDKSSIVDEMAIRRFARFKVRALQQVEGVIHDDA